MALVLLLTERNQLLKRKKADRRAKNINTDPGLIN